MYEWKIMNLSDNQRKKLRRFAKKDEPINLMFKPMNIFTGPEEHKLPLTQTQINKLEKNKGNNKGARIKLSVAQVKELKKSGGALLATLGVALATGALSALGAKLGSVVIDKIDNAVRDGDIKKLRGFIESDIYDEDQKQVFREKIEEIQNNRPNTGEGLTPHGYGYGEGLTPHGSYSTDSKKKVGRGDEVFPNGVPL